MNTDAASAEVGFVQRKSPAASPEAMHGAMGVRLFLVSVLVLYLELLLIRWIGTEIRIFAYLQNTVLVVCFFGLGIGLFTSDRRVTHRRGLLALFVLAVFLLIPFTRQGLEAITGMLSLHGQLNLWVGHYVGSTFAVLAFATGLAITFLLMTIIIKPFIPLGRVLGRLMDKHPKTIMAYSINVFGSLTGIWLFVFLSSLEAPPALWFAVLCVLYLPFLVGRSRRWRLNVALLLAVVPTVWLSGRLTGAIQVVWSPYQKLALYAEENERALRYGLPYEKFVEVNNTSYQAILDLSEEGVRSDPEMSGHPLSGYSQYDIPYRLHPSPSRVLIVGAGAGNDAAGALRHGVKHVTAVDIDPVVLEMGRKHHPEQPYRSDAVRLVIDDARSFFASTPETYDVIVFGLLDSHTTTAMTNARLDHYVYTRESIKHVRRLLAPGGIICLSFEASKPFIADRMAVILKEVFGKEPIAFRMPRSPFGWGGVVFVAGDIETAGSQIARDGSLRALVEHWQSRYPLNLTYETTPTTDDWPYLYLERPRIPILFVLLAGLMALLVLYTKRTLDLPAGMNPIRWRKDQWHFAFLGAGFLLLEVQNISKGAVVLGNTWVVNAIVISGILMMILFANLVVSRLRLIPSAPVYAALIGTTLVLYFLDLARFAFLPFWTKAILVGALTSFPIFFSGIAFIKAFNRSSRKDIALGANLLGALAGGILQSLSFLTGVKALLLVVAAFYVLAFLTRLERQPAPKAVVVPARTLDPTSPPVTAQSPAPTA